jgi:hypothetical protein
MQVGAEEWSFSLTKECLERETKRSATIREGPAQTSLKFRDQNTPKIRRFACTCSLTGNFEFEVGAFVFGEVEKLPQRGSSSPASTLVLRRSCAPF